MDATTRFIVSGLTGTPVSVVVYDEGETRMLLTEVVEPVPLVLKLLKTDHNVRPARRVMLLSQIDGVSMRADAHLNFVRQQDGETYLELGAAHWEMMDRRRHTRVEVKLPANLRIVTEDNSAPQLTVCQGLTHDMSISGALVEVTNPPPAGTLVELQTEISGETIKVLAVVAHSSIDRSAIGLHFVEYIHNARFLLHKFLQEVAA